MFNSLLTRLLGSTTSSRRRWGRAGSARRAGRRAFVFAADMLPLNIEKLEYRILLAGDLDVTFGTAGTGIVTTVFDLGGGTTFPTAGLSVSRQADGQLLAVARVPGGTGIARYSSNAVLDGTFGTNGTVVTLFGTTQTGIASDGAIQPDGKIVVAGSTGGNNSDVVLARYLSNGNLDPDFGTAGISTSALSAGIDTTGKLTVQPDGRIVVTAFISQGAGSNNFEVVVLRYNANGSLDTSFAAAGVFHTGAIVANQAGQVADVQIQTDGRLIVLAGESTLLRLSAQGDADGTFGAAGRVNLPNITANCLALQSDGRILVGGNAGAAAAVNRFLQSGQFDPTFGTQGQFTVRVEDHSTATDAVRSLAEQADGRLIAAGSWFLRSAGFNAGEAFVFSLLPDGKTLDGTFNGSGIMTFGIPVPNPPLQNASSASDVVLLPDGKIVVIGTDPTANKIGLARINYTTPDSTPAPQRMYRAYNTVADQHFYATSLGEYQVAVQAGYRDESTGPGGFQTLTTLANGALPVHRLYNLQTGNHYYTVDANERDVLLSINPPPATGNDSRTTGWRYEKDEGYVYLASQAGTTEIFRLYNASNGDHLYTENPAERDSALAIDEMQNGVPTGRHPWQLQSSLGFGFVWSNSSAAVALSRSAQMRADDSPPAIPASSSGAFLVIAMDNSTGDRSTAHVAFENVTVAAELSEPAPLAPSLANPATNSEQPTELSPASTATENLRDRAAWQAQDVEPTALDACWSRLTGEILDVDPFSQ